MYQIIGLNSGLKLFYLAADSASDAIAAATVVHADSHVTSTTSERQDDRSKSGTCALMWR